MPPGSICPSTTRKGTAAVLEPITLTRVVSTPQALGAMHGGVDALVLRTAPDEALVVGAAPSDLTIEDAHAIVIADGGWAGIWLDTETVDRMLAAGADWRPDDRRPLLAQGMLVHLPVKLWLEDERALLLTQRVFAADLGERIGALS
jgi:hypothetical protein